ncbi:hypothetical protein EBZ37_12175, partial [bacterium]|nr:hypothetical protein [bacterium]
MKVTFFLLSHQERKPGESKPEKKQKRGAAWRNSSQTPSWTSLSRSAVVLEASRKERKKMSAEEQLKEEIKKLEAFEASKPDLAQDLRWAWGNPRNSSLTQKNAYINNDILSLIKAKQDVLSLEERHGDAMRLCIDSPRNRVFTDFETTAEKLDGAIKRLGELKRELGGRHGLQGTPEDILDGLELKKDQLSEQVEQIIPNIS